MENDEIVRMLRAMAAALEEQGEDGFRAGAYRRAASYIEKLPTPVRDIYETSGVEGLVALPTIGYGVASAIVEMLVTGQWQKLDHVAGEGDPVRLLQSIPGVGPGLAAKIHDALKIDTLEQLEVAAHDGSLDRVPGIGARRAAALRALLAVRLGRRGRVVDREQPPVSLLLEIDREYRDKAAAGALRLIAPRRFNPEARAWLPIWHPSRGAWRFTALYSNTERAHRLGKTHDWVVIYAQKDHGAESQCTVVTEAAGELSGKRVVRGRETECTDFYGVPKERAVEARRAKKNRKNGGGLSMPFDSGAMCGDWSFA